MTILLLTMALSLSVGGRAVSTTSRLPKPWCYWVPFEPYEREVATYQEAAGICHHHGLYLTSIHSAEENDFVLSLLWSGGETSAWIGVTVERGSRGEVQARWEDGSPLTFTNWLHHRSHKGRLARGCVYVSSRGDWHTGHCDHPRRYVCKMATSTYTTIRRSTRQAKNFYYNYFNPGSNSQHIGGLNDDYPTPNDLR